MIPPVYETYSLWLASGVDGFNRRLLTAEYRAVYSR